MAVYKELSRSQIIIWSVINGIIIFYCIVLLIYSKCYNRNKENNLNDNSLIPGNNINSNTYFKRPFSDLSLNTNNSITLNFMKNTHNKIK